MKLHQPNHQIKLSQAQRHKIASTLCTAMFSLIWEGDYSPQDAPGEDAIYATLVHALDVMAGAA
jgi:hypothetical protein